MRDIIRVNLACSQYAMEEGFELGPDEIESAADAYRSEHELTTAEDTERWLADHALALDDFLAWLERGLWRQRFAQRLHIITRDHSPDPRDVDALLWPEIVFGDRLAALARDLAARVAALLAAEDGSRRPEWADDLSALERRYLDVCREAVAGGNIDHELAARGSSLMRLEVQIASFPSEPAAREAWLCVTEDGETLDEVSRRAGGDVQHARLFLDELPEALRQPVFSAAAGQVVSPIDLGDRVVVCRVAAKERPASGDVEVMRRVESASIERAIEDLIQRHIRWA